LLEIIYENNIQYIFPLSKHTRLFDAGKLYKKKYKKTNPMCGIKDRSSEQITPA
jgi:hypothetical protein